MSKKKNLKTGIQIEDDLTKEERAEIQKQLREKVKEERTKGKKVKVGKRYMKIFIEDCVYIYGMKRAEDQKRNLEETEKRKEKRR